ncbi:MAG: hypothetical protein ACTSYC_12675 [Promethearchaeota archaeon]
MINLPKITRYSIHSLIGGYILILYRKSPRSIYLLKQSGKILDAGGCTGFWSPELARRGHEIICMDLPKNIL